MARLPDSEKESFEFAVDLPVFRGPFDLLLQLIARRELDVTEVALSLVTDEFIEFIAKSPDLSTTTEFLVIAATLLEMKAASLLPQQQAVSTDVAEDLSMRDLLFSRLLQYRAFKEMAKIFGERIQESARSVPRQVELEPQFAALMPALVWRTTPADLAELALTALRVAPNPQEAEHVARIRVSVEEQVSVVQRILAASPVVTFRELIGEDPAPELVIGRFLALLELYRRGTIRFSQSEPLTTLTISTDPGEDADE